MTKRSRQGKGSSGGHGLPDWAVPGVVLLGKEKTPIEKGYTHLCARRYEEGLEHDRERTISQHLERGLNIGFSPPRGLVVIDADNREACVWLEGLMPDDAPRQRRTDSKQHWYVRVDPEGPFYTRGGLRVDVGQRDVARIDVRTWGNVDEDLPGGGYAVIPPSKHESGEHYAWAVPFPSKLDDVPFIPDEVLALLAPFFQRHAKSGVVRRTTEMARHDQVISHQSRLAARASRDPERGIAEVMKGSEAFIRQLFVDDPSRLKAELDDLERNCASAYERFGGSMPDEEKKDDRALADLISAAFGDPWLYCSEDHRWYEWDGRVWRPVPQGLVEKTVYEFPSTLIADAQVEWESKERRGSLLGQAAALSNSSKVTSVTQALRRKCTTTVNLLDQNPDLITFPESESLGLPAVTLNIATGETHEPDPEDYITKLAGAPYAPGHTHDVVEEYLRSSFPDEDTRRAVEELAGLTLSGRLYQESMISLYGRQGSGKGTLGFSMCSVLGDYSEVMSGSLINGKGESDGSRKDFSLHRLRGSRYVFVDEYSGSLGEKAKGLIQAGRITASVKYSKDDMSFPITHTIWIATNKRPKIWDPNGMERRIIEIPMNAGAPDIHNLDNRIKFTLMNDESAMAALLWRFIEGLNRIRERGAPFKPELSKEIIVATREWLQEANLLGDWLTNDCEVTGQPGDSISGGFARYIAWMDENRPDRRAFPRAHKNEFSTQLQALGFERVRVGGDTKFIGLRYKESEPALPGKVTQLRSMKRKKAE